MLPKRGQHVVSVWLQTKLAIIDDIYVDGLTEDVLMPSVGTVIILMHMGTLV